MKCTVCREKIEQEQICVFERFEASWNFLVYSIKEAFKIK